MTTPFSSTGNFHEEVIDEYNRLAEQLGRPQMEYIPSPRATVEDMATEFEKLAAMPENGNPIYCSRMHFRDWAKQLRYVAEHVPT